MSSHFSIAIIGSGFGGLGMAIRLKQEGLDDFVVFERASEVGGTWRDNTYPGCACDVQSHLYSFSFAPNPEWSRMFSPQPEIQAYLRRCASQFGVRSRIRFGHEVSAAEWDEKARLWRLETSHGPFTARVVVAGNGPLNEPAIPRIPGIESFQGKVFHSARWDHGYDLAGRSVAVIGTGASAIQFVPAIQPRVGRLHVFQRTPPWVIPHPDRKVSRLERRLFRALPLAQKLPRGAIFLSREFFVLGMRHPGVMRLAQKVAERHLKRAVRDPALRAKLMPSYAMGCKRILLSNEYWPAIAQPNVEVVTDPIREVRRRAILTQDGTEREVDTIIFGTGFKVTEVSLFAKIRGRGGIALAEAWKGSPKAYLGTAVFGFPNLFLLLGPNTGLGHSSVVLMIESQIAHVLQALRFMRKRGVDALEPRLDAQQEFVAQVDAKMRGTVWTSGGCASWYLDKTGRNSTLWPGFVGAYRRRVERFDPSRYLVESSHAVPAE